MKFLRPRLRTRIYLGYGVLIALLLGIAGYGSYGLSVVGDAIDKMDAIAGNTNRAQELALRLEEVRRGMAGYRIDRDSGSLLEVSAAETRAAVLLRESADYTLSEQRRAMFTAVAEKLNALKAAREHFASVMDAGAAERDRLLANGATLRTAVAGLTDAATASGDANERIMAMRAGMAVLAVEASGSRFLASHDPERMTTFGTDLAAAPPMLSALDGVASPEVRSMLPPVASALKSYAETFDKAAAPLIESETIYAGQINPELRDMQDVTGKGLEKLVKGYGIVSERAYAISSGTLTRQLGLSGAAAVAGIVLAILIARTIRRPINSMTAAMSKLAAGDSATEIPGRDANDEIGEMARALEVFRQQATENHHLEAARRHEQIAKERRQKAMDQHTQEFGSSVTGVMESFSKASATMRQAAADVAEGARLTRASTASTVEGAMTSSQNLATVAAGAEEMSASIGEISEQVAHISASLQAAVNRATEADVTVAGLSSAVDRIGDVVRIISEIAGQTNLLALNATIEAARAGAAGKGFAVVAGEVKALASQTARATEEIGAQISAIRGATGAAVTAMRELGGAIHLVETVAAAIASAVEEQAATTREIANSVQQVAVTTSDTVEAMRNVLSIVEGTDATSQTALTASEAVSGTAQTLRSEVTDFLTAMSQGDEAERRGYERIPGGGRRATLRVAGRAGVDAIIEDISRGGVGLTHTCTDGTGTDVEVTLPGGESVKGRIARNLGASVGVVFFQDQVSLKRIDQALAIIREDLDRRAA